MCNDLYLVNQHEIPYIMQKIILKKFDFYRGKKIFSDPIPLLGRITSDTNMKMILKCLIDSI